MPTKHPLPYLTVQKILVFTSCIFMLLPLGSIYFLHLYENALIHQTESELISQAAFATAVYKQNIMRLSHADLSNLGKPITAGDSTKYAGSIIPTLDLGKSALYPNRPMGKPTTQKASTIALLAGKETDPILLDAQHVTLSGIKILDENGIVVAGKNEKGLSFQNTLEFIAAQNGRSMSLLRKRNTSTPYPSLSSISRAGNVNVFVSVPIIINKRFMGAVWLNRTPPSLLQTFYSKRWQLIWTLVILTGITTLITALTALTITVPIRKLIERVSLIAKGDKASLLPIEHPVTREVAILSETMAHMAKQITYRSEYIQNFATHVSHEFKTPLTSIQGSIELLSDDWQTMPEKQRQQFLTNIQNDTQHLKGLVLRLLTLARADMSEYVDTACNIVTILENCCHYFQAKGLTIDCENDLKSHAENIRFSAENLEAILSNLFENSKQAGASKLALKLVSSETECCLRIFDNGSGISETNAQHIFTPFFTTKRKTGGTGLGLSIVKTLLEKQDASIQWVPTGAGCCFQLIFKIAQ